MSANPQQPAAAARAELAEVPPSAAAGSGFRDPRDAHFLRARRCSGSTRVRTSRPSVLPSSASTRISSACFGLTEGEANVVRLLHGAKTPAAESRNAAAEDAQDNVARLKFG